MTPAARNLDFLLRLVVAPMQAEGARILAIVPVFVIGYLAVSWFDLELVKAVVYGLAAVVAIGAAAWCHAMGMGFVGNCAFGVLAVFVWQSEAVFDVILPKEASLTVKTDVPATVDFRLSDGDAFIIGSVTNLSDRQMQYATVQCLGTYRNGKPAEKPWTVGVGDSGWTMPGASTQERRLIDLYGKKPEKFDLAKTRCSVSEATFRDMPMAFPDFRYAEDVESGYTHFTVTNGSGTAITHVRFACVQADNGVPVNVQPEPIYQTDPAYSLAPGETIELRSKNRFPDLDKCRVYSVDPADPV